MDLLLSKLADNFPFALALIVLVVICFRAMRARDQLFVRAMETRDELFVAAITKVTDTSDARARECHAVQRESTEAIAKTGAAINEFNHHARALTQERRRRAPRGAEDETQAAAPAGGA
jgi:hypothetical protein